MKNASLILNVVLVIAVAFLYFLHFNEMKPGVAASTSSGNHMEVSAGTGIVFVNSDSLLDEYQFYKDEKKQFEESQDKIKSELKAQSDQLQREVEKYQQEGAGMTESERAKKEEQLTMKQQQLMQRKEELVGKLDEQQSKSSEELYSRLNQYLRKYNEGKNYHFVLGYQKGGGILFANDSLNITKDVVEGLNKEYKEKK
jgi:outer membrane protein